jgi:hypothetical protein
MSAAEEIAPTAVDLLRLIVDRDTRLTAAVSQTCAANPSRYARFR